MKNDICKTTPYFHDIPAADIQKWFMNSDLSDALALMMYRGRGVYEGLMETERNGYKYYKEFSFELEKDSLGEYLEKVEDKRHETLPEKEEDSARVNRLNAVVDYLNNRDIALPVQSDVSYLDELIQVMRQNGIIPEWFAWMPAEDGKIVNVASAEKQDRQAPEEVLKVAQSMYDSLNQSFEPLLQKAGFQKLDGMFLSGVGLRYDLKPVHYQGTGKVIYDDLHNTAIIRCDLTR